MAGRTVRINGLDWRIEYCHPGGCLSDKNWGECLHPSHPLGPAILILVTAAPRMRFATLVHELIHATADGMFQPEEPWVIEAENRLVNDLWKAGARWPRPLKRLRKILRADIPSALVTRIAKLYRQSSGDALCKRWTHRAARDMAGAMLAVGVHWPEG